MEIPPAERARGQRAIIRGACASSVIYVTAYGSVATLFLLSLGASPFHVGAMSTLMGVGVVGQVIGLWVLPRYGKARVCSIGRMASGVPVGLLALLAARGAPGPASVWLTIAALTAMNLVLYVGDTGWWPLIQDNTAGDAVGAFLVRMRTRLRLIEIATPLLVGWYLGARPPSARFVAPFLLCAVSIAASGWSVRGIAERRQGGDPSSLGRLRAALGNVSVRRFLHFLFVRRMVVALSGPFWVVLLNARGLPAGQNVWMGALGALGNVCGLRHWGRLVDDHGSRPAFAVTLVPGALLGLAWLFLPEERLMAWAVAFYLAWGFFEGGYFMGQTHAVMHAVPAESQAEGFALVNYAGSLGSMAGAFLGGIAFDQITRWAEQGGPDGRILYLVGTQAGLLVAWILSTRLPGYKEQTPARRLAAAAWRRATGGTWR
ncbi:MAG: MFS transporter [Armatimonadetes bacterium]|nr:MFS transporter [Armatimonadota bacterium]